jgi:hypothetical protein
MTRSMADGGVGVCQVLVESYAVRHRWADVPAVRAVVQEIFTALLFAQKPSLEKP